MLGARRTTRREAAQASQIPIPSAATRARNFRGQAVDILRFSKTSPDFAMRNPLNGLAGNSNSYCPYIDLRRLFSDSGFD